MEYFQNKIFLLILCGLLQTSAFANSIATSGKKLNPAEKISKMTKGDKFPEVINVIIEIPAQSPPVKYEMDKNSGAMFVDRFLTTSMFYPCNYGFVPQTLSEDGDPVDVLVITPVPLVSGSVIEVRPIGKLNMVDEEGTDTKILAVPTDKISKIYSRIKGPEDVDPHTLSTISHFFEHYKDLESNKWVKIGKWENAKSAKEALKESVARYNSN